MSASPDPLGVPQNGSATDAAVHALGVTHHEGTAAAPGPESPAADVEAEGPPAFYYDFRDPWSYLAAERVLQTLPVATPWVPIDASRLPGPHAWEGFRCAADQDAARERVAQVARERGLQPVRWPVEVPFDSRLALLAAWYAKGIGRVVSFSLPAFRQAFAGGHDLSTETYVLLAASACEMHPRAVVQAFGRPSVAAELDDATTRAIERGVQTVPAVWTGDRIFHGDDQLEAAAAYLMPADA
ncbi:MAG: DsbA family protein [Patulibacter sp.]